ETAMSSAMEQQRKPYDTSIASLKKRTDGTRAERVRERFESSPTTRGAVRVPERLSESLHYLKQSDPLRPFLQRFNRPSYIRHLMLRLFAVYFLALGMVVAGIGHFTMKDEFVRMVPAALPWPEFLVVLTGVLEMLSGIGHVFATKRRLTA